MELIILSKFASRVECAWMQSETETGVYFITKSRLIPPIEMSRLKMQIILSIKCLLLLRGDKKSPRPFGPSITRNLITRVLTICHVKLFRTALEQKRFDLRSLSPALRNLWLLLICTRLVCMFCFPSRGPRGTWPFVFS